jgi:hypothetical protein
MVNHPTRSRTDGAKITKHKDEQGWRIYVGGRPTDLIISKGDPPRYRERQTYDLWTGDYQHLLEAPGVSILISRLETIQASLSKGGGA